MTDRELDAAIAEKVMGWKRGKSYGNGNGEWKRPCGGITTWNLCPPFSTDIAAAMEVAANVCARPDRLERKVELWTRSRKDWAYAAFKVNPLGYGGYEFIGEAEDDDGNLSRAICLAALAAVQKEPRHG